MIFIALPVNESTPPTARQNATAWILHEELANGEIGLPIIVGGVETDILLTNPTIVAGVEKLAYADELEAAIIADGVTA